ncbi:MAG: O-antigen ligase family protein [Parcubacteria group bacterium]
MLDTSFFGKYFRASLLVILLVELLSFLVYWLRLIVDLNSAIFLIITAFVFILSLIKLEYGLYAAILELFIGSQGHLFNLTINNYSIGIRIGIFCAVMLAWTIKFIFEKNIHDRYHEHLKSFFVKQKSLFILGAVAVWGIIFALIRHNSLSNIFFDFNAWLYFLYLLPMLGVFYHKEQFDKIIQILTAAIAAIAAKSLIFLYVFSHNLPMAELFYKWGRDSRWGEFTPAGQNLYRIFSQAQIFALLGFFIVIGYLIFKGRMNYRSPKNQYLAIIAFSALTAVLISLSRSFWLAMFVSILLLLAFAIFKEKISAKDFLIAVFRLIFIGVMGYGLIACVVNFPYPNLGRVVDPSQMLLGRASGDAAVSSRWSELPNLLKAIAKHPLVGSGWGATVTYVSQDPRIKNILNPTGAYTTYAFEWGYLDIILKIGLIGLAAYLAVIWSIFADLKNIWKQNEDRFFRALLLGFAFALIALLVTHAFSPYLNHPLGIGFIILLFIYIRTYSTRQTAINA